jgi:serine/threonine-protein kinase
MGLDRLNTSVGGYRLSQFLGEGGMGEVFRGVHERTQRTVAVKILSSVVGARELARFYHEARVLSTLEHPNIVKLFELITLEGRPCLVMEYVEGESLGDRITRVGQLPVRDATRFLRDIASAVAHIHAQGIIHRDIKPHNVRVTPRGDVKLLDFGIAVSSHVRGLTSTGNVIGTPRYLSPEQRRNDPITPASDVWALGVLYYEMTTGRPPFDGATNAELLARMDSGKYPLVSKVVEEGTTGMLRGIDALIRDCLAQDPRKRLGSAAALAGRADALLADLSEQPAPPQAPRRHLGTAPVTPAKPATGVTKAIASTASALERRWQWLAIAAGAVVVGIAALLLWGRGERVLGPDDAVYHIAVQGTSGRAEVFVDGHSIGLTPASYEGKIGQTIVVELKQDGYEPVREQVSLTANEGTATFPMERKRAPSP